MSIAISNIAIAIVFIGLLGHRFSAPDFPSLRGPLEKPLWIYFFIGIMTILLSGVGGFAFGPCGKDAQMVWDFYIFSSAFALEGSSVVLWFWAAGFAFVALLGIAQFCFWSFAQSQALAFNAAIHDSHFWSAIYASSRAHGAIHPVTFGEIMGMALLGALSYRVSRRRKEKSPGIISGMFTVIALAALALSGTRGAWAGFFLGAFFLVVLEFRAVVLESLIAVGIIAAQVLYSPRFSGSAMSPQESSFKIHLSLWKTAWRMFLEHPVLGVGSGHFGDFFGQYHFVPYAGQATWGNAHNLYLHQLAERGLLGFAALALVLGTMLVRSWKKYQQTHSFLSLWSLCWMLSFLVMNLTESAFQVGMVWMPTLALYCWMERDQLAI